MKKVKNKIVLLILSSMSACHTVQTADYNEPNSGLIVIGAAAGAVCFRGCFYACLYGLKKCFYSIKKCLDSCDKYKLKELSDLLDQQQKRELEDQRTIPVVIYYEKNSRKRSIVPPLNLEQLKTKKSDAQAAPILQLPPEQVSDSYHESDGELTNPTDNVACQARSSHVKHSPYFTNQ